MTETKPIKSSDFSDKIISFSGKTATYQGRTFDVLNTSEKLSKLDRLSSVVTALFSTFVAICLGLFYASARDKCKENWKIVFEGKKIVQVLMEKPLEPAKLTRIAPPTPSAIKKSFPETPTKYKIEAKAAKHALKIIEIFLSPELIKDSDDELKNDETLILYLIQKNAMLLEYASDRIKNNLFIVFSAYCKNPDSLQFASLEMQKTIHLIVSISKNETSYNDQDSSFKQNVEIAKRICWLNGSLLKDMPEWQDDNDVVDFALNFTPSAIVFASDRFKNHKPLILYVLEREPRIIFDLDTAWQKDEDVISILNKDSTIIDELNTLDDDNLAKELEKLKLSPEKDLRDTSDKNDKND